MSDPRFDPRPRLNRLPANPEQRPSRFPSWLHRKLPRGSNLWQTERVAREQRLHTVCEEARCPNRTECWSRKTATFLVMGRECTRACGFCSIDFSASPKPLEADEPRRIVASVKQLDLRHVVITMVARDDLPDGGGGHLAQIVQAIHAECEGVTVELLTSDFNGNLQALETVLESCPLIFNHNLETVRALTPRVRHKATYDRSLRILARASETSLVRFVKSGLMVGLGEQITQVQETLRDLAEAGAHVVTIGQYLPPLNRKLALRAFIHPDQFAEYAEFGRSVGIPYMYCGPLIRSSYNADLLKEELVANG
jgi:lipoyl synthase